MVSKQLLITPKAVRKALLMRQGLQGWQGSYADFALLQASV